VLLDAWSERAALLKAILSGSAAAAPADPARMEHNAAERKFTSMSPTVLRRDSRRARRESKKAGGEAN
jgi:hypothetical protein